MMSRLAPALLIAAALAPAVGCAVEGEDVYEGEVVKDEDGKADSSAAALFVDFDLDGELVTDSAWNKEQAIEDQLLYSVGQLNGDNSVGRLDRLTLSNVVATSAAGGKTKITYHAKFPVAWGDKLDVPTSHALKLPRDMSYAAQSAFATKYGHDCVDFGAHDIDAGSMFYYFRPNRSGCTMDDTDTLTVSASVSPSPINTTGKFPEYDLVWADDALNVVAVFGKYEDGATTSADAGIAAYNDFVRLMKAELSPRGLTTVPATVPSSPGVATPDIEFRATLPDGKTINVVALLVDNVRTGGAAFDARYNATSSAADYIVYNGHAGLGANVRALATKGSWVRGQYVIVFMNGCDTYAYVDGALASAHEAVNPDDPNGTKYVDIVLNAMPSYFSNMAGSTMHLFRGLVDHANPKTYEQLFAKVSASQVVLVTGEQDNTFTPGGGGDPTEWAGLSEAGTIARSATKAFATPTLAAGTYNFQLTGTSDADLYVRIGSAPTTATYDCRPYKSGSNESCDVTLAAPAPIHVMVRGYAASSTWELVGSER